MPINTGLVEFWPLTSNNLVGAFASNVLTQGGGLTWDSANSCWTVTSSTNPYLLCASIALAPPFTIAVEVYGNGGASGDYTYAAFTKNGSNYWTLVQRGPSNSVTAIARSGASDGVSMNSAPPSGTWNQVAGVFASSTSRQAFLAGALSTANTTSISPAGASNNLTLGATWDGAFPGSPIATAGFRFRNFAVWNRALTQAELVEYFSNPSAVLSAGGPTINTHPTNQTVTAGATATFSVAATASAGSLTYQWQRNGSNISGATGASYTTPGTTVSGGSANNGDAYRCVVTDSNGSTTSNAATLTVNSGSSVKSGLNFFYRKGNGNV